MQDVDSHKVKEILLLVMDMQDPLLQAVEASLETTMRCSLAVEVSQLLNIPLAFTEQSPQKLGPTVQSISKLAPEAPIFEKNSFSAFRNNKLQNFLEENKLKQVILAGLETPICIYQTALDLGNHGYTTTVFSDCIGSRRPNDAKYALKSLMDNNCEIVPLETFFYNLIESSNHPKFKEFTRLIKKYN